MRILDQTNLFTREDTFFGVCQGLGEDLGVSPTWFRLAFSLGIFFSPVGAIALYAAAGVLVFVSRWLAPVPATAAAVETEAQAPAAAPVQAEALPLAA